MLLGFVDSQNDSANNRWTRRATFWNEHVNHVAQSRTANCHVNVAPVLINKAGPTTGDNCELAANCDALTDCAVVSATERQQNMNFWAEKAFAVPILYFYHRRLALDYLFIAPHLVSGHQDACLQPFDVQNVIPERGGGGENSEVSVIVLITGCISTPHWEEREEDGSVLNSFLFVWNEEKREWGQEAEFSGVCLF